VTLVGKRKRHQEIPASGPVREALRHKGQFWTPHWIAAAMIRYVSPESTGHLFDPAVGACAFFRAWKQENNSRVEFFGCDIDLTSLREARSAGLTVEELHSIEERDFVLDPPQRKFLSIVANPPYIRHHRLSPETKQQLRLFCRQLLGREIDGRAGLHVYFLLRALDLLAPGGKLSFIISADTFEGVFARTLWEWITRKYVLEGVVTFSDEATPFPGVDTNAVVLFIRNSGSSSRFQWARCTQPETPLLADWVQRHFSGEFPGNVFIRQRVEAVHTGLTRSPQAPHEGYVLGDLAWVLRGIATGANEFFFMNQQQVAQLGVPEEYLIRAIGRTRDVSGDTISVQDLSQLSALGRPTYLLSIQESNRNRIPEQLHSYLVAGEVAGLPDRPLIASRKPWYRMESRSVPDFLFAYLGRRNARFIRNDARVVPLTGFLCVYSRSRKTDEIEKLWRILSHPRTLENLRLVGKSYGSGAVKVEPRALERLPLAEDLLSSVGLKPVQSPRQIEFESAGCRLF
jgi:adenine-specific DNA-methyltransferase